MKNKQITKICACCNEQFPATCGAAKYCSVGCHLMGSIKRKGECWEWSAGRDKDGYGVLRVRGRQRLKAHRASYAEFVGVIPAGAMICHHCDNPSCINPKHLFVGTAKTNKEDCVSKDRHVRGERLTWKAKLTETSVREIRADTRRNIELAAVHGVTKEMIGSIRSGKSWKHVK